MSRTHARLLGPAAAALTTAVLTFHAPSYAWCPSTTQKPSAPGECATLRGTPLRWASICAGVSILVDPMAEIGMAEMREQAAAAGARWHTADCGGGTHPYFDLQRIGDTTTPTSYNSRGPNANTVSFNRIWKLDASHRELTIAITIVTFDAVSAEIEDADVELNSRSDRNPAGYSFTTGDPTDAADLPTILTHEFGHFHGISHSPDAMAVMYFSAGEGEQRRALQRDDIDAICMTYPEGVKPSDTLCNVTPYGGFAISPGGGKVRGGCNVAVAATADSHGARRPWFGGALAVATAMAAAYRRRRQSPER